MAYYTYEGDSLVLVNDPPNAVYVPRDVNGDGNIRYYILDSAGRMVGSTLTASEVYTFPEIVGQVLMASGFISTIAGTATAINIRASGREVS